MRSPSEFVFTSFLVKHEGVCSCIWCDPDPEDMEAWEDAREILENASKTPDFTRYYERSLQRNWDYEYGPNWVRCYWIKDES